MDLTMKDHIQKNNMEMYTKRKIVRGYMLEVQYPKEIIHWILIKDALERNNEWFKCIDLNMLLYVKRNFTALLTAPTESKGTLNGPYRWLIVAMNNKSSYEILNSSKNIFGLHTNYTRLDKSLWKTYSGSKRHLWWSYWGSVRRIKNWLCLYQ